MPLPAFTGTLGKKAAAHLLRRATFGPTRADIDTFAGYTPATALNALFQNTPLPSEPVLPGGGTWLSSTPVNMDGESDYQQYIRRWWLGLMLGTNVAPADQLAFSTREKITFFLHSHFTTVQETVNNSRALYYQNRLLRMFAFDGSAAANINIKTLAKKISIDNAMLILLDGRLNIKGSPNENYARELLELYTIGKGLSGQIPVTNTPGDYLYFTETDVQEAAKVLSGYDVDETFTTIDLDTNLPRGKVKMNASVANQHNNSTKTFSNRLGNLQVIPNTTLMLGTEATEASMLDELDQLIEIIFNLSETRLNICRKIYRFYVYHDITPDIETNIISQMVTTLVANNYKIEPVIRELLASQHFYDSLDASVDNDQFGALIKSPLDLVCGTLRFFEYSLPDYLTQSTSFYTKTETLIDTLDAQGMDFMNPFDVAGYEAYHQFPLFNRMWINTNALTQRYKFIFDTMTVENTMPEAVTVDLLAYMKSRFAANATDPDAFVREVISYLFPMYNENSEITPARLEWFKNQLLKLGQVLNQPQPTFWVFSWNNAANIPASGEDARGMLQDMMNAMLQSPEYQLF
ncbi:MAG: DUF1800 domain-containing protein [Cytophagaceae bacterium]|jgi:uncharacterized protein (DUF1800 family)|nr:DUF1800 domain-containing protein [Cytophagaceae bacterium]